MVRFIGETACRSGQQTRANRQWRGLELGLYSNPHQSASGSSKPDSSAAISCSTRSNGLRRPPVLVERPASCPPRANRRLTVLTPLTIRWASSSSPSSLTISSISWRLARFARDVSDTASKGCSSGVFVGMVEDGRLAAAGLGGEAPNRSPCLSSQDCRRLVGPRPKGWPPLPCWMLRQTTRPWIHDPPRPPCLCYHCRSSIQLRSGQRRDL
jgi:hypothetical protein